MAAATWRSGPRLAHAPAAARQFRRAAANAARAPKRRTVATMPPASLLALLLWVVVLCVHTAAAAVVDYSDASSGAHVRNHQVGHARHGFRVAGIVQGGAQVHEQCNRTRLPSHRRHSPLPAPCCARPKAPRRLLAAAPLGNLSADMLALLNGARIMDRGRPTAANSSAGAGGRPPGAPLLYPSAGDTAPGPAAPTSPAPSLLDTPVAQLAGRAAPLV